MTCAQLPLAGTGLPGLCHKTLPMANQNQPKTSPIPEVNVSSVKHYNITHVICMQNRSAQPADKKFNPRQHFKSSPIPLENRGPGNTGYSPLTRWRAAPPPFLLWVKTRHFPSRLLFPSHRAKPSPSDEKFKITNTEKYSERFEELIGSISVVSSHLVMALVWRTWTYM